jgi:hypothetical protein
MRRILLSTLKVLISAALLYFALRKVDLFALASRASNLQSLGWIALAVVSNILQLSLGAIRWSAVSTECGATLPNGLAMRFTLIGAFFNQMLPSSIGGDAVRLWLMARAGAGWTAATYSTFIDRAIGLIVLAFIIFASLPWSYRLIRDTSGRSALLLLDFVALAAGLGFLLLGRWHQLKRWWVTHHLHSCAVIASRLMFSPTRGPMIAVISILVHILSVVIAWCIVRSINAPVTFAQTLLLIPPVMLITTVPISIAGWGVREAALGLAFSYSGLVPTEGVNVALLFGAISFLVSLLGGIAWVLSPEKASSKFWNGTSDQT